MAEGLAEYVLLVGEASFVVTGTFSFILVTDSGILEGDDDDEEIG